MIALLFVLEGSLSAQSAGRYLRGAQQSQISDAQMRIRERIQRQEGAYSARVTFNNDSRIDPEGWGMVRVQGTGVLFRGRYDEGFSYDALYNVRNGNLQNLNYQFYNDPEDPGSFNPPFRSRPGGAFGGRPTGTVRYSGALMNLNSGKCVDIPNYGESFAGEFIQQWSCAGQANQVFDLIGVGGNDYAIFNRQTQSVLEIPGQRISEDGAELQQSMWTGEPNQLFRLVGAGSGNFRLINALSGKCLDVDAQSGFDGAKIHQWTCGGQRSQVFRIR